MTETEQRTIDEALSRFKLVQGAGSETANTACVMTALSWVVGAAWSDQLPCTHPILRRWAIQANDADGVTGEQRAEMVKAGATGLLDTWWVPTEVLLWAWSESARDVGPTERMVDVCGLVSGWKAAAAKQRPNLAGANLADAYLAGANLADAYLADAYLAGANLADAYLAGANLAGANLAGANLADAYLARANLAGANLAGAYLARANLARAYLADAYLARAYLARAYLADANLARARYSRFTALPGGFDAKAAGMVEL